MANLYGVIMRHRGFCETLGVMHGLLILAMIVIGVLAAPMRADAAQCSQVLGDAPGWQAYCAAMAADVAQSNGDLVMNSGTCQDPNGVTVPACCKDWAPQHGGGVCEYFKNGYSGPPIEEEPDECEELTGEPGPPVNSISGQQCAPNGCVIESAEDSDSSICFATECRVPTVYSGGSCEAEQEEAEPFINPEICGGGKCMFLQDPDGDISLPGPVANPEVCMSTEDGNICIPIDPNLNAANQCKHNPTGALCTGLNGTNPPRPNDPPHHPTQMPAVSAPVTVQPGNNVTNVNGFGPGSGQTEPVGGECPDTTRPQGRFCVCEDAGRTWNGTACVERGGAEEGEERNADQGSCEAAPACSGDEIDCSILRQTWEIRHATCGEEPPEIDMDEDFSDQAEGIFEDREGMGPGDLNDAGWLGGGSCPQVDNVTFNLSGRAVVLDFQDIWCDLEWLSILVMLMAYTAAARIIMGG